jgi:hypothetical protein
MRKIVVSILLDVREGIAAVHAEAFMEIMPLGAPSGWDAK